MSKELKIKICGLTQTQDIITCCEQKVDFIGMIFAPKSSRYLQLEQAKNLMTITSQSFNKYNTKKVGVFVKQNIDEVLYITQTLGLDYVQLHGDEDEKYCQSLGTKNIIKVVWAERILASCKNEIEFKQKFELELQHFAPYCEYFLCDAGQAGGGSGKSLNWQSLASIRFPKPWFLAGGLHLDNATHALKTAQPNVLDFNSGLELSPGIKNIDKIIALNQWRKNL